MKLNFNINEEEALVKEDEKEELAQVCNRTSQVGDIYAKLSYIQTNLKAPKNLYNKFGGYKYRNAEGILEAVKPYLAKTNTSCIMEDKIVMIGERYYVKATATLIDNETGMLVMTSAYAREAENKKGMDESQVTGATSSYARKYALNGLFALDDTKDADTEELHDEIENRIGNKEKVAKPISPEVTAEALQWGIDDFSKVATWKKKSPEELTDEDVLEAIHIKKAKGNK